MDIFARGILENSGIVGGVRGANGHGWVTERPKPPRKGVKTWGHCIWFGAYGTDEIGRFIATPNSWGKRQWNKKHILKN